MTNITQNLLDDFKAKFPDDHEIHKTSLDDVKAKLKSEPVNWEYAHKHMQAVSADMESMYDLSPCDIKAGYVIYDCVCLALNASSLRSDVSVSTIEDVAGASAPVISKLGQAVTDLASDSTSAEDKAKAVFLVLKTLYETGCLASVVKAIVDGMGTWDKIKFGLTALATIVAVVATDGVAWIAKLALTIMSYKHLLDDSESYYENCLS